MPTHLPRVLLQPLLCKHLEHREAGRRGNGIAAEGGEELHAVVEGRGDLPGGDHRGQGKAVPDGFAKDHDVRHHPLALKSPEGRTQAAEARLHFVCDHHPTRRPHRAIHLGEVARR